MNKIIGIGTDIVEIERIQKAIQKNKRFLNRVFTKSEQEYVLSHGGSAGSFAGLFAAKEAAVKAAGGLITNYEILHEQTGKPYILHKDFIFELSISHCDAYATAFVIAMQN